MACTALTPVKTTAADILKSRFFGIFAIVPTGTAANSAKAPLAPDKALADPYTLFPTLKFSTPSPISVTTPAISPPKTMGNGKSGMAPCESFISKGLTDEAYTLTKTCPLPAFGFSISTNSITLEFPNLFICAAFTLHPYECISF